MTKTTMDQMTEAREELWQNLQFLSEVDTIGIGRIRGVLGLIVYIKTGCSVPKLIPKRFQDLPVGVRRSSEAYHHIEAGYV